jgi:hypothetical protein
MWLLICTKATGVEYLGSSSLVGGILVMTDAFERDPVRSSPGNLCKNNSYYEEEGKNPQLNIEHWTLNIEQECRDAFKLLSEGDDASVKLWQQFTDKSLAGVRTVMSEFGVTSWYLDWWELLWRYSLFQSSATGQISQQITPCLLSWMNSSSDELLRKRMMMTA